MLSFGCTHYPLIEKEIREVLGNVKIFNGAKGLAVHLKDVLKNENLLANHKNPSICFIDTSNSEEKKERFIKNLYIRKVKLLSNI